MARQMSRREFLTEAAGGATLLPTAVVSLGAPRRSVAAVQDGEPFWEDVRRQFAFPEDTVPMNAANLCPSPTVVADRVTELTRDIDADCSSQNRAKFQTLLEESRRKVAAQLGVMADEVALVRNTSEANNTINNGLRLGAGDEVIVWDQNHPTNNVAWDVRAARFGLVVTRVATPRSPGRPDELVKVFQDAFTARTRVLAITHISNVSGIRLPVRELCEAAHRRGIYVHVDGAQTWGLLDVKLRDLGCDSFSASAHKWFAGPKEVGLLYVKADRIAEIWPNVVAPGWGADAEPDVAGARKFESMGQRDDAALAAIGTTVDFHARIGARRIEARVTDLATRLKAGLRDAGLTLVTPMTPELSGGVCVAEVPSDRRRQLVNTLYRAHGIAGAATGGLRLCPHLYNTREHVERAIRAVTTLSSSVA